MVDRSPLAPKTFPDMPPIGGVQISVAETKLKYKGRPDLLMMAFDEGTSVAGVFTKSLCPSAPVDWCRQHLSGGEARGLIVNAGNANAFTGQAGADACEAMVAAVADTLTCRPSRIYAASTGVIGEVLPAKDLAPFVASMTPSADANAWQDAATAIMAAEAGQGITGVYSYMVSDAVQEGRLVPVLADHALQPVPVQLVYPEGRFVAPKLRAFMDFAAPRLSEILEDQPAAKT